LRIHVLSKEILAWTIILTEYHFLSLPKNTPTVLVRCCGFTSATPSASTATKTTEK